MQVVKVDIDTAAPLHPEASILIMYTGGTVGMVFDKSVKHLVPFNFTQIMDHVPELRQFNYLLTVLSIEPAIDSSNVSVSDWLLLARLIAENYNDYDGFVVLHGTDTMAYSASALSYLLDNLQKPVIFTGAQVPIGRIRTDARENLITALQIAATKKEGKSMVPEVCIYFRNLLLRGNRSKKAESTRFDAFKSGNYPPLAETGIEIDYNTKSILPHPKLPFRAHQLLDDRVAVLKLFPGITSQVVRSILHTPELRGVVLETFGAGNAPTGAWFLELLQEALNKGMLILNVSQCDEGRVDQGRYETSKHLQDMGIVGGADITTEAAISKMMYVLSFGLGQAQANRMLSRNLRGEVTI
ncbi:asparaginase [Pontibacter sp. 172403-2]|uniref:asparaginase n=1 Tax=Pontibacter rufus TaxID=2791028 RepID=UPI0018AF7499|nr:asparaginase [Pontibacter sp. 172403-2]MBF9254822.1 asparaginase [Pontibacter sp. 172403-2]